MRREWHYSPPLDLPGQTTSQERRTPFFLRSAVAAPAGLVNYVLAGALFVIKLGEKSEGAVERYASLEQ